MARVQDSGGAASVSPAVALGVRSMYEAHADELFLYFARRVGRDLAEDLLSEVFSVAITRFDTFDSRRGSARMWLFGIGSNLLLHHWRSERRRLRALAATAGQLPAVGDPFLSEIDRVDDALVAVDAANRVVEALEGLDHDDRTLLFLSGWEQLTSAEIASVLGRSPTAVRSRLSRLRRQLRGALDTAAQHSEVPR